MQQLDVEPISVAERASALHRILEPIAATGTSTQVSFPKIFSDPATRKGAIDWYLAVADHLNALAGLPVADKAILLRLTVNGAVIAVPCMEYGLPAMHSLLGYVCEIAAGLSEVRDQALQRQFARLRAANEPTSNGPRMILAAMESGTVVQELPGNLIQYGLGTRSVLVSNGFNEHTSTVATRIARDKPSTSNLLRRFRLPVPVHRIVRDIDGALQAAEEIGYPVVVKPRALDGGVGVQADLVSPDELRDAFSKTYEFDKQVMVQKHFQGRDYRLTVFRGRMIWAIERRPGGVFGDGRSTVNELVAQLNAEPDRGEGAHFRLRRIKLDDEAFGLLSRNGLTPASVLSDGQFCCLRRTANVTSGGMPIAVNDRVHPENAKLAVRAAEVIGLDFAGIDLITPDITVAWQQGGAIICEVNAAPEIGGTTSLHIYPFLLREMLGGDGNIPVIAAWNIDTARMIAGQLKQEGFCVGLHTAEGISVGGEWLERGNITCLSAGHILVGDKRISALVLGHLDVVVLKTGLPVPRVDLLVLGDDAVIDEALLDFLKPSCKAIVTLSSSEGGAVIDRIKLSEIIFQLIRSYPLNSS